MASLAEVVANLRTGLPPAALEAAADGSHPLTLGALLAQLQSAAPWTPAPARQGLPLTVLETIDAYRWAVLVGLNYGPVLGRPGRLQPSVGRPRCQTCRRLLELARDGLPVCPTCL